MNKEEILAFRHKTTPLKSRTVYVCLALILGCGGFHNFYAGRHAVGASQLLLTVFTLGAAAPLVVIWLLIEVFVVDKDGLERDMY